MTGRTVETSPDTGKTFEPELNNLYVSGPITRALMATDANFAASEAEAKQLADKGEQTQDEQWLGKALALALGRIGDLNAMPVEKLE